MPWLAGATRNEKRDARLRAFSIATGIKRSPLGQYPAGGRRSQRSLSWNPRAWRV
jgi:hypothetical protein